MKTKWIYTQWTLGIVLSKGGHSVIVVYDYNHHKIFYVKVIHEDSGTNISQYLMITQISFQIQSNSYQECKNNEEGYNCRMHRCEQCWIREKGDKNGSMDRDLGGSCVRKIFTMNSAY